jgi:hypothetical protein
MDVSRIVQARFRPCLAGLRLRLRDSSSGGATPNVLARGAASARPPEEPKPFCTFGGEARLHVWRRSPQQSTAGGARPKMALACPCGRAKLARRASALLFVVAQQGEVSTEPNKPFIFPNLYEYRFLLKWLSDE